MGTQVSRTGIAEFTSSGVFDGVVTIEGIRGTVPTTSVASIFPSTPVDFVNYSINPSLTLTKTVGQASVGVSLNLTIDSTFNPYGIKPTSGSTFTCILYGVTPLSGGSKVSTATWTVT